jgi:hypothetical protein
MSIQELANLAEVLGVFGLLASVVYVGRQLRQSTLQMRVAASNDRLQLFLRFYLGVAGDREFAELWGKGESGFSTLDEVDQSRLLLWETAGLAVWSHDFDLHRHQLLPDDVWKGVLFTIEAIGHRESVRRAWESNRGRFAPPFQEFMSRYLD